MMSDRDMMARCIALAKESRKLHEYPYAAVICRRGSFVCEFSIEYPAMVMSRVMQNWLLSPRRSDSLKRPVSMIALSI
jgi:hypothetical protein